MKNIPWNGRGQGQVTRFRILHREISPQRLSLETSNFVHGLAMSCDEWVFPKWAWSGSREQFLHCELRKFCHSKSSVCRWYTQLVCGRFVCDTYRTMEATRSHQGGVHMFTAHCLTATLQLHNLDLFRTCRTSSFCTVPWQLARFQLTRHIAWFLGDSWASCIQC